VTKALRFFLLSLRIFLEECVGIIEKSCIFAEANLKQTEEKNYYIVMDQGNNTFKTIFLLTF